eukprot:SRR837773.4022.p4 GENE.SRR837773.4022~~SRR837773.4022.p4  ORF type:complete len:113 (-),score=18.73 SRR837773.4022:95-433(-)
MCRDEALVLGQRLPFGLHVLKVHWTRDQVHVLLPVDNGAPNADLRVHPQSSFGATSRAPMIPWSAKDLRKWLQIAKKEACAMPASTAEVANTPIIGRELAAIISNPVVAFDL